MNTVYLIDLDGTTVPHGAPRTVRPEARARLDALGANSDNQIYFFSCWCFSPQDIDFLIREFPYARGFIRKPLGDRYIFVDDKHSVEGSLNEQELFGLYCDTLHS